MASGGGTGLEATGPLAIAGLLFPARRFRSYTCAYACLYARVRLGSARCSLVTVEARFVAARHLCNGTPTPLIPSLSIRPRRAKDANGRQERPDFADACQSRPTRANVEVDQRLTR